VSAPAADLGARSGVLVGASFVAGMAGAMALADLPYPRPGAEPAQVKRYFTENAGTARVSVAGQAISAVALARFTASVARLAGLRTGELPRPLAVAGMASAAASLASPLYFLAEPAGWLIPAGRFSGLVVTGIAGVRLGRGRR